MRSSGTTILLAMVLALLSVAMPTADAQDEDAPLVAAQFAGEALTYIDDPDDHADTELVAALASVDLLDAWVEAGTVSPQAALLEVDGDSTHDQVRSELLASIADYQDRSGVSGRRADRLANAETQTNLLAELSQSMSEALKTPTSTSNASINLAARQARAQIARAIPSARSAFSLDPLDMVEERVQRVRSNVVDEFSELLHAEDPLAGNRERSEAFADFSGDLAVVRALIAAAGDNQSADPVQASLQADLDDIRSLFPRLHELRALATTEVGALPLVTIDAYVQAADIAPDGCTVDWPLLVGIGRIESRHGTLNSASVQASGKLTESIFGPLLDGGATKAEAEAAARAAEEAAAAAVAAEEAEAARIEQERQDYLHSLVWGDEAQPETVPEDVPDPTKPPEPTPEPEEVRFDPALWGDAADEVNAAEAAERVEEDDAEEDAEEKEEVLRGNGFAVIRDTDGGALDGNSRWDRAVGPMQFIPETWSYWKTDGNGDGWTDPQNLYDAAASAARFLCRLQASRGQSPYTFVLGYNASDVYVQDVMAVANDFAGIQLPEILAN